MLDLTRLRASVSRATTVDGSAAAIIRGIVQQIREAIAADDLQDATALNELVATLDPATDDLAAAVSENTPAGAPAAPQEPQSPTEPPPAEPPDPGEVDNPGRHGGG